MTCFLSAFLFESARAAENIAGFLCVMDKATGFSLSEQGSWQSTNFNVDKKYWVTRRAKQNAADPVAGDFFWVVTEVGREYPSYYCKQDFDNIGNLLCAGLWSIGDFMMNSKTLRFQSTYLYGYVVEEKGNTPYLAIGKCSSL
jgi:hypothetical protein